MMCTQCKLDKAKEEFSYRNKAKGVLRSDCKECASKHHKNYYKSNAKRQEDIKRRRKEYRNEIKKKYITHLATCKCEICGENHPATLDFDHIDPTNKRDAISQMVRDTLSWDIILVEINKCRVLCSNCHRKHTALQFNWYK